MIYFHKRLKLGRFVLGVVIGKEELRGKEKRKMRTKMDFSSKKKMKAEIFKEQNGRCKICKNLYRKDELEIDHIVPLRTVNNSSLDIRSNIQLLCSSCHVTKTKEDMTKHPWIKTPKRVVRFFI